MFVSGWYKQWVNILSCSSLVVLSHCVPVECLTEGQRTKCWKLFLHRCLKHLFFFFIHFTSFSRGFVYPPTPHLLSFWPWIQKRIQCGCSYECCMHNTEDQTQVIFLSLSVRLTSSSAHSLSLFFFFSTSKCSTPPITPPSSRKGPFQAVLNTHRSIQELPCIKMCVCVCVCTFAPACACLSVGSVHLWASVS